MLVLIRHGQPEIEKREKCFLGHTHVHMQEEGKLQMHRAAKLCPVKPEKLWVSTSMRCQESAAAFLECYQAEYPEAVPEIEYLDELQEINMGIWDGKSFEEIKQKYPAEYEERGKNLASYCVPQGESFLQVQKRAVEALQKILRDGEKNHVLITHLGVMRTIRCYVRKLPLEQLMEWKCGYGEMLLLSEQELDILRL